jgi:hypothetical protein
VAVLGGALAQPHIAAAPSMRLLFHHPPKALPIHQDDFGASMILWPPFQFEPLIFLHIFSFDFALSLSLLLAARSSSVNTEDRPFVFFTSVMVRS